MVWGRDGQFSHRGISARLCESIAVLWRRCAHADLCRNSCFEHGGMEKSHITPCDTFTNEYDDLLPFFITVMEDPAFRGLDPQAHRRHLEAYQRQYSLWFHNNAREKWRKWLTRAKTNDGMWHQRSDAYIAHLVQNEILNRDTVSDYLKLLQWLGSQYPQLERLTSDMALIIRYSRTANGVEDSSVKAVCGENDKVVLFQASAR